MCSASEHSAHVLATDKGRAQTFDRAETKTTAGRGRGLPRLGQVQEAQEERLQRVRGGQEQLQQWGEYRHHCSKTTYKRILTIKELTIGLVQIRTESRNNFYFDLKLTECVKNSCIIITD